MRLLKPANPVPGAEDKNTPRYVSLENSSFPFNNALTKASLELSKALGCFATIFSMSDAHQAGAIKR